MLPEGSLLVLYTDGLTESTRDVLEGERRLREALARDDIRGSSSAASAIRRAVLGVATDDIAILTVSIGDGGFTPRIVGCASGLRFYAPPCVDRVVKNPATGTTLS